MEQLEKMLTFLLPLYAEEGKSALVIAIGCTGGHHRSVAVAHELAEYITEDAIRSRKTIGTSPDNRRDAVWSHTDSR